MSVNINDIVTWTSAPSSATAPNKAEFLPITTHYGQVKAVDGDKATVTLIKDIAGSFILSKVDSVLPIADLEPVVEVNFKHKIGDRENSTLKFTLDKKGITDVTTENGKFGMFEGYAAAFGNIDRCDDVIQKGAFTAFLATNPKIKLCWQHDMEEPIGSVLEAYEDANGLYIKGRLNLGTEQGMEAYALLKAGDLDSMSIGYIVKTVTYSGDIRIIESADLVEISIVTYPANERAQVTLVKSMVAEAKTIAEIELVLKAKGFSNREAKTFISTAKKIFAERDASQEKTTQRDVEVSKIASEFLNELQKFSKQLKQKVI